MYKVVLTRRKKNIYMSKLVQCYCVCTLQCRRYFQFKVGRCAEVGCVAYVAAVRCKGVPKSWRGVMKKF